MYLGNFYKDTLNRLFDVTEDGNEFQNLKNEHINWEEIAQIP